MNEGNRVIRIIALFLFFLFSVLGLSISRNTEDKTHVYLSYDLTLNTCYANGVEKSEYVNNNGEITFAADKHYAVVEKTYDGENRVVREDYYDEFGNPAYMPAGYCSQTMTYISDLEIMYKYLDENNEVIVRPEGYSIITRTYISADECDYIQTYYYSDMKPFIYASGYHSIRYCYDGNILVSYTYLDEYDEPVNISKGYATVLRSYYDDNNIKAELFLDRDNNPVKNSLGQYGIIFEEYDQYNRRQKVTTIDESGNPTVNSKGYASTIYTYYPSGAIKTERYFDINGNPCMVGKAMYGTLHDGEKTFYLDKNGRMILTLDSVIRNIPYIVILFAIVAILAFASLPSIGRRITFILYLLIILYETIFFREQGDMRMRLNPIESYSSFFDNPATRIEVLNNIWLFVPYGFGVKSIFDNKNIITALFLLPMLIEISQLIFGIGTFETSDLINNGLGELIGLGVYCVFFNVEKSTKTDI